MASKTPGRPHPQGGEAPFNCCLPPVIKKSAIQHPGRGFLHRLNTHNYTKRLLYLTPEAIVYFLPESGEVKRFKIKPLNKLKVERIDHGKTLLVETGKHEKLRLRAPRRRAACKASLRVHDALGQWERALKAAAAWQDNDPIILPPCLKFNQSFAKALWDLVFQQERPAAYRDIWLRWLANPAAQNTIKTMHATFSRIVRLATDAGPTDANAFMQHLQSLHQNLYTRMIVNAIEVTPTFLNEWMKRTTTTTTAAGERRLTQTTDLRKAHAHQSSSILAMFVANIAMLAKQAHRAHTEWPEVLCLALNYPKCILKDQPIGASTRATLRAQRVIDAAGRIIVSREQPGHHSLQDLPQEALCGDDEDEDDADDGQDGGRDSAGGANSDTASLASFVSGASVGADGVASPFNDETTAAILAEEERLSTSKDPNAVPVTSLQDFSFLFDTQHLRYLLCLHWARSGNAHRYIEYIQKMRASILQDTFKGPKHTPLANTDLCLLLPCLEVHDSEAQDEILAAYVEAHGLNSSTFAAFATACMQRQEHTSLLAYAVRVHFRHLPELIPNAVSTLLAMAVSGDSAQLLLLDAVVALVGAHTPFTESVRCWLAESEGRVLQAHKQQQQQQQQQQYGGVTNHAAGSLTEEQVQELAKQESERMLGMLMRYATSDLCKVSENNRCWVDPKEVEERTELREHLRANHRVDISHVREQEEFHQILSGFVRLCLLLGCYEALFAWASKIGPRAFGLFFQDRLREDTIDALRDCIDLLPECADMIHECRLLNKPIFFSKAACSAMDRSTAKHFSKLQQTYFSLLSVAEQLDDYASFAAEVDHLVARLSPFKSSTILDTLHRLCSVITAKGAEGNTGSGGTGAGAAGASSAVVDKRAGGLAVGDLVQCSLYATDAMFIVSSFQSKNLLEGCIEHYINNCHPSTWVELFRKLDVIAFFVKYLVRESYGQAFSEFRRINGAKQWALQLLDMVAEQFDEPLIDVSELRVEEEEAQTRLIERMLEKGRGMGDREMRFIAEFTGRWMQRMKNIVSIPMTPHNTQIITTLLFSAFYRVSAGNGSCAACDYKTLIAEVGTGEGKSVIIIMMALYFVCVHGRRVHILENNVSLLDRDYNNYKAFFSQFKNRKGGAVTAGTTIDQEADITYCLQKDVESLHRQKAPKGENVFGNVVLIVDEVDDLVIDQDPVSGFVKRDEDSSRHVKACFEGLQQQGTGASQPGGCPRKIWTAALQAYGTAKRWQEGRDYGFSEGKYRMLDQRGRVTNFVSLALHYVNFEAGHNASPSFDTVFYVVSTPHVFNQYAFILGLTGSVGGEAEREYLQQTYSAGVLSVPPFLNTCEDAAKHEPEQRVLTLVDNASQQRREVVRIARDYAERVPVLVITENPEQTKIMWERLAGKLGKEHVQLLLEVKDGLSQKDKWQSIIDTATQPVQQQQESQSGSGGTGSGWRVTVTDYFGGRGHDYKVTDEDVNDAGGMLVVITNIPDSYREWVQWKGRTSRQDRNGQLALVLNTQGSFLQQQTEPIAQFKAGALDGTEFVQRLLQERNKAMQKQLNKYADKQRSGMAVNELCDRFYKKFGPSTSWPSTDTERKLRDFLQENGHTPPIAKTKQMAQSLGIGANFPY